MRKGNQSKNGFAVLVLDILFVAAGIFLLIVSLSHSKKILAAISSIFFK
jgi:hypothetical protein